ncbi:MAG: hypothetical protein VX085_16355, partial [Pseudomonadota bacterium]|nr:hypothetical protein [Pseudomonadota bacterium]
MRRMAIDAIWTIVKETTKLATSVMAVVKTISPAGRHSRCRIHLYAAASRLVVGNLGTFESGFQVRTHRI